MSEYKTDHLREFLDRLSNAQVTDYARRLSCERKTRAATENAIAYAERMRHEGRGCDLVLSPFAGIGSEGYVAVSKGRQFVGIELKPSYFNVAVNNMREADRIASQKTLFDFLRVDNCEVSQ